MKVEALPSLYPYDHLRTSRMRGEAVQAAISPTHSSCQRFGFGEEAMESSRTLYGMLPSFRSWMSSLPAQT